MNKNTRFRIVAIQVEEAGGWARAGHTEGGSFCQCVGSLTG